MQKQDTPLISIIIPVYNIEQYVGECLDSVCRQTYTNLEIIVVNDGSTDSSETIINQWKKRDNRIVLINQENQGLSAARNTGLDYAQGEYIGFIDADDYIHENMYMELYQLLKRSNCPMAMCAYSAVNEVGETMARKIEDPESQIYNAEALLGAMLDNIRNHQTFVSACNKLYKKSLFDDVRYPVGKLYEDNWIIHTLVYKAERIAFTNSELYYYRQRGNSIMHRGFLMRCFDDFSAQVDRIAFLESKKASQKLINRFGQECVQSGISYWFQMKYYKCAPKDEEKKYYQSVKAVVKKFISVCPPSNRLKGMLFLKMPGVLYGTYWVKRKLNSIAGGNYESN